MNLNNGKCFIKMSKVRLIQHYGNMHSALIAGSMEG